MTNPPFTPQFYAPWMKLGNKKVQHQLQEIRVDTVNLLPIVRATAFDDSALNWALDHAVQAWEIGEKGFKNKFRVYWDKSATRYKIQRNAGTEGSPTWVDALSIDSSGVIRDQNGVTIGGSGSGSTVTFTDGANIIVSNELNVNSTQFYFSKDLSGNPVLNFFGSSGGASFTDKVGIGTGEINLSAGVAPANLVQWSGQTKHFNDIGQPVWNGVYSDTLRTVNAVRFSGSNVSLVNGFPTVAVNSALNPALLA